MSVGIATSFDAPAEIRRALQQLGRTEDVRFSPDNRRLVLPSFDHHSIAVLDLDIAVDGNRTKVVLNDFTELPAPGLDYPHAVEFLDDATIIVANRNADITVFQLPSDDRASGRAELTPIDLAPGHRFDLLNGPSALAVTEGADGELEVLTGHRRSDVLTRHVVHRDSSGSLRVTANDVLVRRGIAFTDGVAVSPDHAWVAISDPWHQNVLVYERSSSLNEESEPRCILRGASYPHGVRFSPDGRHLFVADAGSPHVHVHASEHGIWRGVQYPAVSLRVVDDHVFQRGRSNCREGGPKGVDIDRRGQVLAVTCEQQPLAFFDASLLLECGAGRRADHERQVNYELAVADAAATLCDERIAALKASRTYRWGERLRRLRALWPSVG